MRRKVVSEVGMVIPGRKSPRRIMQNSMMMDDKCSDMKWTWKSTRKITTRINGWGYVWTSGILRGGGSRYVSFFYNVYKENTISIVLFSTIKLFVSKPTLVNRGCFICAVAAIIAAKLNVFSIYDDIIAILFVILNAIIISCEYIVFCRKGNLLVTWSRIYFIT